jgi:hypothetical protein
MCVPKRHVDKAGADEEGKMPRRLSTRSHGRGRRVMMVVYFSFASIPDFCLKMNRVIDKTLRRNVVATDQSSEALM